MKANKGFSMTWAYDHGHYALDKHDRDILPLLIGWRPTNRLSSNSTMWIATETRSSERSQLISSIRRFFHLMRNSRILHIGFLTFLTLSARIAQPPWCPSALGQF